MAMRDELLISRSSSFLSRRALAAVSTELCWAGVWIGSSAEPVTLGDAKSMPIELGLDGVSNWASFCTTEERMFGLAIFDVVPSVPLVWFVLLLLASTLDD